MAERETLKFEYDLGEDRACMRIKSGTQSRDCNSRGRKSAKNCELNRYIFVITHIDEKKFVFF